MFQALASVGGFTLLSRITGYARDAVMAAILGAGPLSDAFLVALRLPNHFRAIFAEGAFTAAFLPLYTGLKTQEGRHAAQALANGALGWQLLIQGLLLAAALLYMPQIIPVLAPGFADAPEQLALAADLTRITFSYLICMTIVTQIGAMLNAQGLFKAAAAAPVLLNAAMIAALLQAVWFPSAAHAAAWGVFAGGIAELILMIAAGAASGVWLGLSWPKFSGPIVRFARAFGPALIGSAGVQLALFADTILATYLAAGELTSLYYADRINQLPLGVIGVALGTVLLPEISRQIASGKTIAAAHAQNRAMELALILALPAMAAFVTIPDLIMRALFARGAFDASAAEASGQVLFAYALGLPAFVLIRACTPIFHGRGDTATPAFATFVSIAVNLALKSYLILGLDWGAAGLALGTVAGAWVNLILLAAIAYARGMLKLTRRLRVTGPRLVAVNVLLGSALLIFSPVIAAQVQSLSQWREEIAFLLIVLASAGFYLLALWAMNLLRVLVDRG